jgi:hypothetical protein
MKDDKNLVREQLKPTNQFAVIFTKVTSVACVVMSAAFAYAGAAWSGDSVSKAAAFALSAGSLAAAVTNLGRCKWR